jgi:hypothetical protein
VTRIKVIVEGPTEESFIKNVLAMSFWPYRIYLSPIVLGVRGHQGGRTSYARVKKDVLILLKQDKDAYCSTMLDLYGLGRGFPGTPLPENLTGLQKVLCIEESVKSDICSEIPDLRPDIRFIPYIQLYEYEGLLFSDSDALAAAVRQPGLAPRFREIRDQFPTPEDINDDPNTAPSKRLLRLFPRYKKVVEGTLAASQVGVEKMESECPHFRSWLDSLRALGSREAEG